MPVLHVDQAKTIVLSIERKMCCLRPPIALLSSLRYCQSASALGMMQNCLDSINGLNSNLHAVD